MASESNHHYPPLDNLPCGLLVVDTEDRIVWINARLTRWLNAEPGRGLTSLDDVLSPACRSEYDRHWRAELAQKRYIEEVQVELLAADAPPLAALMSASIRNTPGGELVDFVFLPDSERAINARELRDSQDELRLLVHEATRLEAEAQDRALFAEQMVGIVSHDLRNPLQAIHMGVLALTRGNLTTNQIRVLGRVSRSTERAHRLIADLLDFTAARVGAGLAITRGKIHLNDVIAEAVEELALAFPDRKLDFEHGTDDICSADADRLAQLVGNLVANAMTYGEPTRPVTVSASVVDGIAQVSVHNWGRPIGPELIDRLFQPMVRGEARGQSRSVGLGLYIVGEIAKAHGGEVAVDSGEDRGTTFTAAFPVV